jgi:peptidoglycan hydrolase CwlO-like protein
MSTFRLEKISLKEFREILARYPSTVPAPLKDLDVFRYDTLPAQLASAPKGSALEKASLKSLVEWKLCAPPLSTCHLKSNPRSKHGTFRPTLLGLVDSNDAASVRSATNPVFDLMRDTEPIRINQAASMTTGLKFLAQLRGVGPATASLVLSVLAPDWCPFFSDELYRWCVWDEGDKGKGRGWKRKITYTDKQYRVLFNKVWDARERLGVQAVEIEKVAWVLGRTRVDLDLELDAGGLGAKLGELEEKQENIDHRQNWIEDEQDALGDKQADLDGKQADLEGKQADLDGKQVDLDGKQKELEDKQEELEDLEDKLEDKQCELEGKQGDLEISLLEAETKQIQAESRQDELEWKQEDLRDELKEELKEELKSELKEELKEELKAEMKKEQKKEVRKKEVQKKEPKGTKRKAKDAELPAAGTRRSTRNKK